MASIDPALKLYIAAWVTVCFSAVVLAIFRGRDFAILRRSYWHFIAEPWKLLTFIVATLLITLIAPYTGDPTWDYIDGFFMSVLCYVSAPWVVAVLYSAARGRAGAAEAWVAVCTWLFSASWSYDIYLVWRDGEYPLTWLANLYASSLIYLCAGLFWNLEWQAGRGVLFSFMREGWPSRPAESAPMRLFGYGLLLALPVIGALLIYFV